MKLVCDVLKQAGAGGGENNVINVHQQVGHRVTTSKHEEGHVALESNKAKTVSMMGKPLVPSAGCLLEAVERLVKQADILGTSRVDEARRLLVVNHLVEIAMEKGVLDV
jgi:hypothetical protein